MIRGVRRLISIRYIFTGLAALTLFSYCGNQHPSNAPTDTTITGTINISADESFEPVIKEAVKVFEASYPEAHILVNYKPEAACIRDLDNDSVRMVIVTRGLSPNEEKYFKNKLQYTPIYDKLAFDAVAVVVNAMSKDTVFDVADLRAILKDSANAFKLRPVMDGLSATSTVRYAIDSLLKGQPLGKHVMAATSSQGVIDYVAENPNAIGFVGVSWIGNREDKGQRSFLKKVKIASVECASCDPVVYTQPLQYNIAARRYPMVRGLYYILKENYSGLGSGFANFLNYERGQLIFRRAYLWPAKMSFDKRTTGI